MTSEKPASVDLAELQNALDFVSSGELIDCSAYISLDTGKIIYHSSDDLGGEDIPEDLEASDRYIAVPHKRDLDLGRSLALFFTGEELPDDIEIVAGFFRRKGAYSHFKDLLARRNLLDKWYDYENRATEQALRSWCAENGIQLLEKQHGE
jgi:hypothetical protein